ncbi:MFS transporter [Arsenicicoccus bolidensis]|uniref:MFS transporter n=1 Tax=Arsenicicoccus bolidensis TaxID=229480 RepID=A0ABS9Q1S2_9MICO|nr:MFS transporter [Arsenicicoccus bolidensis]MCG7321816.1 MFS transporter [Arsenicicoccus bolidensis]
MSTTTPRHAARPTSPPEATLSSGMTHKEVLETLSGLLLGMFVAILSSTVVSNALPTIVSELHGSESGYTWVVTATLLATTISTPIWGKLADLFSKKLLVQLALVIFVLASMAAGLSNSMGILIATRVFQGLGAGGLTSLSQVILATIVSPRERGRYSGYLGATFALGTVAGPLVGGALTEHLSWRWCFYVGVPFALLAIVVLQKTLHLPTRRRGETHIDYLGAILLAGGVSSLLVWVSLAGDSFDWWSWQTGAMVGGGIVLIALTVMAEQIAPEPIIPLRLFRSPVIVLASTASLFVGVAMFAGTVFLGQYFQLARGENPTKAGVMTIPMILGLFLSSTISGQVITRTGRWKAWLVTGGFLLTGALGLLGTIAYDTSYWIVAVWMFLLGTGIGMMMQNLVVAVQNEVPVRDLGVASSFVAFTRSMGGAVGVSALGALLGQRIKDHMADGLAAHHISPAAMAGHSSSIPNIHALKEPIRGIVQDAYGQGLSEVFLAGAPFALLAFLITLFIRETTLRERNVDEDSPVATADASGASVASAGAGEAEGEVEQVWSAPEDHVEHADTHRGGPSTAGADAATPSAAPAPTAGPGHNGGTLLAPSTRGTLVMETRAPSVELTEVHDASRTSAHAAPSAIADGRTAWHGFVGTISQPDARPLAAAQVTVLDEAGHPLARTTSGSNGRYSLDVPASAHPRRVVVEVTLGDQR